MFFRSRRMLFGCNIGNVITALCPGDNITICRKLKICVFDGGTAQLQLLGTFTE